MPGGHVPAIAALVLVAISGYLAGGYLGLPSALQNDEVTRVEVEQSVTDAFGAFAADCDLSLPTEGQCTVTHSDGTAEIYGVTVNHQGCWFAQRTQSAGAAGLLPTGPPVRRGCAG
jgi:hypothetical protein